MYGDITTGFRCCGPFKTYDIAEIWANSAVTSGEAQVIKLRVPEEWEMHNEHA